MPGRVCPNALDTPHLLQSRAFAQGIQNGCRLPSSEPLKQGTLKWQIVHLCLFTANTEQMILMDSIKFWRLPSKNEKHRLASNARFLRNAQGYVRRDAWLDLRTELLSTFCEQIFVQHLLIRWPVCWKARSVWWSGNGL